MPIRQIFLSIFFMLTLQTKVDAKIRVKREFSLSGIIKNIDTGMAFLRFSDSTLKVENKESKIIDGRFYFKRLISYPHAVNVRIEYQNHVRTSALFFIDKGVNFISVSFDSIGILTPNNLKSTTNREYINNFLPLISRLNKQQDLFYQQRWEINRKYNNLMPKNISDSLLTEEKKYINKIDKIAIDYVYKNKSSFVSFWILRDFFINGLQLLQH